jgi:5'(3')-deoxyribonucleotidase
METKPVIAIDIDDVLSETAKLIIEWSNEQYGYSLSLDDYDEDMARMWNVDREEAGRRIIEFHESDVFQNLCHVSASVPVLKKLSEKFKLIIITSRRSVIRDHTVDWVNECFPGLFSDEVIVFARIYDNKLEDPVNMTKGSIASEWDADYLIDDQPKHCISAAEHGVTSLLMGDYKWSQVSNLPKGVYRVKDWSDVERFFGSL